MPCMLTNANRTDTEGEGIELPTARPPNCILFTASRPVVGFSYLPRYNCPPIEWKNRCKLCLNAITEWKNALPIFQQSETVLPSSLLVTSYHTHFMPKRREVNKPILLYSREVISISFLFPRHFLMKKLNYLHVKQVCQLIFLDHPTNFEKALDLFFHSTFARGPPSIGPQYKGACDGHPFPCLTSFSGRFPWLPSAGCLPPEKLRSDVNPGTNQIEVDSREICLPFGLIPVDRLESNTYHWTIGLKASTGRGEYAYLRWITFLSRSIVNAPTILRTRLSILSWSGRARRGRDSFYFYLIGRCPSAAISHSQHYWSGLLSVKHLEWLFSSSRKEEEYEWRTGSKNKNIAFWVSQYNTVSLLIRVG